MLSRRSLIAALAALSGPVRATFAAPSIEPTLEDGEPWLTALSSRLGHQVELREIRGLKFEPHPVGSAPNIGRLVSVTVVDEVTGKEYAAAWSVDAQGLRDLREGGPFLDEVEAGCRRLVQAVERGDAREPGWDILGALRTDGH